MAKVIATKDGFMHDRLIRKGQTFDIYRMSQFSETWMRWAQPNAVLSDEFLEGKTAEEWQALRNGSSVAAAAPSVEASVGQEPAPVVPNVSHKRRR